MFIYSTCNSYEIQERVRPLKERIVCELYIPQCNDEIREVSMPADLVILVVSDS